MDTISVIVEWLTRKITAIRYAQERLTKVFDLVAEIKKVNLAPNGSGRPSCRLHIHCTDNLFGDDEADFQEEYDNGHPDNYSNHNETVEDDSGSDTEQLEGHVMYNKTGEKLDYKKSERKTTVVTPCPLCMGKGDTKLHWLIKCKTLIGQEVNTRYNTIGKLELCHNEIRSSTTDMRFVSLDGAGN
jgi:hypothetical protein